MKISLNDLNLIVDTLLGTRNLKDGGMLFKFTESSRERVALKLMKQMSKVDIDMEVTDSK